MHLIKVQPLEDITNAPSQSSTSPSLIPSWSDLHADLSDVDLDSDDSDLDIIDVPSRTPSRLGFNRPLCPDMKLKKLGTLKWSHSLFQNTRESEVDDNDDEGEEGGIAILASLSSDDLDSDSSSSASDFSDSSGEDEPAPPMLLFPAPAQMRTPPPASPLSTNNSTTPLPPTPITPPRLAYPHHGLSRSALMHRKWFWSARQDEWATYTEPAYGGMAILPASRPRRTTVLDRDIPDRHYAQPPTVNLTAPIYPRAGDISALRDPRAADVDRCFCQYPLWTIRKALFMCDMQVATRGEVDSDADSSNDLTLVEDGPAAPLLQKEEVDTKAEVTQPVCVGETTWYGRWELLVKLVRRDTLRPPVACAVTRPPTPRFFFAEQHEGGTGDEEDEDEEDDYGELVEQPLFAHASGY